MTIRHYITLVESDMPDTLLAKVPTLKFIPVDGKRWRAIQDEGLDVEQSAPDRAQWLMALLPIDKDDAAKLRAFDDETVEKFNLFDIKLKEQFGGKIVDLIDYDRGMVVLVKIVDEVSS